MPADKAKTSIKSTVKKDDAAAGDAEDTIRGDTQQAILIISRVTAKNDDTDDPSQADQT